jgi:RNA polymerase sigma factor (sigma-70 family)
LAGAAISGVDTLTITGVPDHALIAGCVNGDQQAWIQLLDRYKRLIYGVTVRFGFDIEDRHDVFQAVCLETLKSLGSLRKASSLRYWILTITVRQCCSLLKRKREERGQETDEAALAVQDPRTDTMQIYLAAEREKMLREAMEELPERCRSLLDLLFFSDERTSYLELGGLFGWSKDTIGSARLRCLDKVRKILERKGF